MFQKETASFAYEKRIRKPLLKPVENTIFFTGAKPPTKEQKMKLKDIKNPELKDILINSAWEHLCDQTFFMDAAKKRRITPLLEKLAKDPENDFVVYSDATFRYRSEELADAYEPSEETAERWALAISKEGN